MIHCGCIYPHLMVLKHTCACAPYDLYWIILKISLYCSLREAFTLPCVDSCMDRTYRQYTSKTAAFNVFMICSSVQPKLYSAQTNTDNTILWWSNTMNLYQRIYASMCMCMSPRARNRWWCTVPISMCVKAKVCTSYTSLHNNYWR